MIIRSRAPLRLSFAGGGTDVAPYMEECGGAVLSATIDKYVHASLKFMTKKVIKIHSADLGSIKEYALGKPFVFDGSQDLIKAALARLRVERKGKGMEFYLESDAPPGSGLGSSSAVVVALLGIFKHWKKMNLNNYQIAELAYRIEREDLKIAGGKQDQYAAVFGGFNFIEFSRRGVVVNPLRVEPEVLNELQYSSLLCFTGKTRMSDTIIKKQIEGYRMKRMQVIKAMEQLKKAAVDMKNALMKRDLHAFGFLLHEAWESKKEMADSITNRHIDELYLTARKAGALGGKITGAGGGGYMLLVCGPDKKYQVSKKMESVGVKVVPFSFDLVGLQTWSSKEI